MHPRTKADVQCFDCEEYGHFARDCPKRVGAGQGGAGGNGGDRGGKRFVSAVIVSRATGPDGNEWMIVGDQESRQVSYAAVVKAGVVAGGKTAGVVAGGKNAVPVPVSTPPAAKVSGGGLKPGGDAKGKSCVEYAGQGACPTPQVGPAQQGKASAGVGPARDGRYHRTAAATLTTTGSEPLKIDEVKCVAGSSPDAAKAAPVAVATTSVATRSSSSSVSASSGKEHRVSKPPAKAPASPTAGKVQAPSPSVLSPRWFGVDSMASVSISGNRSLFNSLRPCKPFEVEVANN
jgi:hypothetical protein